VSEELVIQELVAMARRAGIPGWLKIAFARDLAERHLSDPRAYADVTGLSFRFAPQIRALPSGNRLGLMAHELGHVLDPYATENGADRAAEAALGIRITYDKGWPGKGLQWTSPKLYRARGMG
jgi:hypothetical protein